MARADLLISIVRAVSTGDKMQFRRAAEALIAEERANHHEVLADRLSQELGRNGTAEGTHGSLPGGVAHDLFYEIIPKRSLNDLFLSEEVTNTVRELVEEQHRSEALRSHGLEPRHRILLIGPPGNGKTSLAEAIAEALMVSFIVVRYEGLIGSYLGETASRLRKLFDNVRTRSCVLFFDEFETLGKERGDIHETGEIKRVVSSLLLQIDDLPPHVIIVTATNHPELLDRAVWRRFQISLSLPTPDRSQIAAYLKKMSERLQVPLGDQAEKFADEMIGASYSELEDFIVDITRQHILSVPEGDIRTIANTRLRQWKERARPLENRS